MAQTQVKATQRTLGRLDEVIGRLDAQGGIVSPQHEPTGAMPPGQVWFNPTDIKQAVHNLELTRESCDRLIDLLDPKFEYRTHVNQAWQPSSFPGQITTQDFGELYGVVRDLAYVTRDLVRRGMVETSG